MRLHSARPALICLALAATLFAHSGAPVLAQETAPDASDAIVSEDVIVPYQDELRRLAQVLGSLHYLRNLCGESSNQWRDQMESLLVADEAIGERRERVIAAFNSGYRAFAISHTQCSETALLAIDRYMAEGQSLTSEILTRFKN